jgi:hypothetical protein
MIKNDGECYTESVYYFPTQSLFQWDKKYIRDISHSLCHISFPMFLVRSDALLYLFSAFSPVHPLTIISMTSRDINNIIVEAYELTLKWSMLYLSQFSIAPSWSMYNLQSISTNRSSCDITSFLIPLIGMKLSRGENSSSFYFQNCVIMAYESILFDMATILKCNTV